MLEKYKPGLSLFSILTAIALLFPPIVWETSSTIYNSGFAFILSIPKYARLIGKINFGQLLVEIILIFVIALLYQLYYDKIKRRYRS